MLGDAVAILAVAVPAAILLLLPLIRWAIRGALRDVIIAETKPRFDDIARAHRDIEARLSAIEARGQQRRSADFT